MEQIHLKDTLYVIFKYLDDFLQLTEVHFSQIFIKFHFINILIVLLNNPSKITICKR